MKLVRVKMLKRSVSSKGVVKPGETTCVSEGKAKTLIAGDYAELVEEVKPPKTAGNLNPEETAELAELKDKVIAKTGANKGKPKASALAEDIARLAELEEKAAK